MTEPNDKYLNVFLFVIWESGMTDEANSALAAIRNDFAVLKEFLVSWDCANCAGHLQSFYCNVSDIWQIKARRNGAGMFRVLMVRDPAPKWQPADDMLHRPDIVDENVIKAKSRYRKLFKVKHSLHSSVSIDETRRNFYMLFGYPLADFLKRNDLDGACESLAPLPPPEKGWRDFKALQEALAECAHHVFVEEPGETLPENEKRLLVDDIGEFAAVTNAHKLKSLCTDDRWCVLAGGEFLTLHVDTPASGRYKKAWAQSAIANSIANGIHYAKAPDDALAKSRRLNLKAFVDFSLTKKSLSLNLLPQTGLPNILRIGIRLGGMFKINFCLGEFGTL